MYFLFIYVNFYCCCDHFIFYVLIIFVYKNVPLHAQKNSNQIKSNQRFLSYICEINISRGKCQITLRLSFGFSVSQWVTQTETMSAVCLGALLAEKLLQERKKAPKKGKLVFVEPWPLFLDECFHLLLTPCWLLRHIWNIFVSCTSLDSHWTVLWCSG